MKRNLFYILLSLLALSAILIVTSCSDDDPSATETTLTKLAAHSWKLSRATVGGVDKTSLFADLSIQWEKDQTFSVTNGGAIWPSTGGWSFTDSSGKELLISLNNGENTEVAIETLNDTQLVISLHWTETTFDHGRVKSIEGDHVFEFEAIN